MLFFLFLFFFSFFVNILSWASVSSFSYPTLVSFFLALKTYLSHGFFCYSSVALFYSSPSLYIFHCFCSTFSLVLCAKRMIFYFLFFQGNFIFHDLPAIEFFSQQSGLLLVLLSLSSFWCMYYAHSVDLIFVTFVFHFCSSIGRFFLCLSFSFQFFIYLQQSYHSVIFILTPLTFGVYFFFRGTFILVFQLLLPSYFLHSKINVQLTLLFIPFDILPLVLSSCSTGVFVSHLLFTLHYHWSTLQLRTCLFAVSRTNGNKPKTREEESFQITAPKGHRWKKLILTSQLQFCSHWENQMFKP